MLSSKDLTLLSILKSQSLQEPDPDTEIESEDEECDPANCKKCRDAWRCRSKKWPT